MKTDVELQQDVLDELKWEPCVDAAEIGVTADDGVVSLAGHVQSYAEKVAAERTAQRVAGVKAVANELEVRPVDSRERTDVDIARAAVDALNGRSSIPAGRVKVAVSKGWVTLEGEVDWRFQRERAEEAIHHLLGIRGILNDIMVKPRASATEVQSRIAAAFRRNAEIDASLVQIEAHGGRVTLLGDVRSWAERQEAERTAWAAPGVCEVDNRIVVSPYATVY